jgi:hypothetical protein
MRIQRREFFTALVGAGAVWPVAARAQQAAVPRIGYLGSSSFEKTAGRSLLAFKRGLADTGYVEDRNVTIEYRWADDEYVDQLRWTMLPLGGSPPACPHFRENPDTVDSEEKAGESAVEVRPKWHL